MICTWLKPFFMFENLKFFWRPHLKVKEKQSHLLFEHPHKMLRGQRLDLCPASPAAVLGAAPHQPNVRRLSLRRPVAGSVRVRVWQLAVASNMASSDDAAPHLLLVRAPPLLVYELQPFRRACLGARCIRLCWHALASCGEIFGATDRHHPARACRPLPHRLPGSANTLRRASGAFSSGLLGGRERGFLVQWRVSPAGLTFLQP